VCLQVALVIFNIYLTAVTLLSHNVINPADGITYRHRPDGSFLNLRIDCRQRLSLVRSTSHCYNMPMTLPCPPTLPLVYNVLSLPLQTHSRNAALLSTHRRPKSSTSRHPVQTPVQHLSSMSARRTSAPLINSHIPAPYCQFQDCLLDDDIDNIICLSSSAFGRLQSEVFLNRDLNTFTKVDVNKAVCNLHLNSSVRQ